jgi:hypothetical protein
MSAIFSSRQTPANISPAGLSSARLLSSHVVTPNASGSECEPAAIAPGGTNVPAAAGVPKEQSVFEAEFKRALVERKTQERMRILTAHRYDDDCYDGDDADRGMPCCGAPEASYVNPNDRTIWLGLGEEEHCPECGAAAEHTGPGHISRLKWWPLHHLLREAVNVEAAYEGRLHMTRDQISKNRDYFKRIVAAISEANHEHRPDRHRLSVEKRHADQLFARVIDLVSRLNGGNRGDAMNEYGDMSRDIDDLYTIIDELQNELKLPPSERV